MNQNQNYRKKLLVEQLAMVLEALERYIREGNYFSNWANKEQFYARTASVYKISLEVAEGGFFSQFSVSFQTFLNKKRVSFPAPIDKNIREEIQKEFYKWIDHSEITAEDCPEKLKHYLNEINEAIENGKSKLYQAYQAVLKEEKSEIKLLTKSPFYYQACKEVDKKLGYVGLGELPISKSKDYELKIEGDAERGQQTFQQIKKSIVGQPEWNFPINGKNYTQKLEEKIKELEGNKDKVRPKEEWKRKINLEDFDENILTFLELYIQKLNHYPNWKIREWTEENREDWRKNWENKTAEEIKKGVLTDLKGTYLMLRIFKADDPDYYPFLLDELKTKFSQWQNERKIDPNNCPKQLKRVLSDINKVLESRSGNIWEKSGKDAEETAEIIVKFRLEVIELLKKYKLKNEDFSSQLSDWENQIRRKNSISEIKLYQQKIRQEIQTKIEENNRLNSNKDKFSWPTKLVAGVGIIGIIFGTIVIIYHVTKSKKVKK